MTKTFTFNELTTHHGAVLFGHLNTSDGVNTLMRYGWHFVKSLDMFSQTSPPNLQQLKFTAFVQNCIGNAIGQCVGLADEKTFTYLKKGHADLQTWLSEWAPNRAEAVFEEAVALRENFPATNEALPGNMIEQSLARFRIVWDMGSKIEEAVELMQLAIVFGDDGSLGKRNTTDLHEAMDFWKATMEYYPLLHSGTSKPAMDFHDKVKEKLQAVELLLAGTPAKEYDFQSMSR